MSEPMTILGVDVDTVIKQVRQLAEDLPDYQYKPKLSPNILTPEQHEQAMMGASVLTPVSNGCVYREANGQPGCIVGHALNMVGVLDQVTPQQNKLGVAVLVQGPSDPIKYAWLREVQINQDKGRPWGRAVRLADVRFPQVREAG